MQKSNAPTKLTVAFASGTGAGPVNTVPLTPGAIPGTASYQTGFTSVNMEPIASGGVPPFGADFNGLFKDATLARMWQEAGYTYSFDAAFAGDANIGGYPAGSVLLMGTGKGLWINQTDNNSQNPDAAGAAGWIGLPAAGTYTINTTGGTTTPDPSTLGVTTLLVAGALTSNATIVLPLIAGSRWIIANNTTGSFTLTVQGATGAGVSITQGSALTVFTDGTSYYAASANISGQYLPINGTAVAATKLATPRAFQITGLATAASINFDGTGNVIFNVTALNVAGALGYTPANDGQVVHIAGTETVTGQKTFSQPVSVSGTLVGGNRYAVQLDNTDTSTGSLVGISMTSGSVGGAVVQYDATTYTGTPFAGTLSLECTGPGGIVLSAYGGGNIQFATGSSRTVVASISNNGAFTALSANFTGSDRRLKRNIRKFKARPLHRTVPFVSYVLKENGWNGLGATAQSMQRTAPEHVGEFDWHGKTRLSLNYAGAAYEQAMWAGQEIDRLTKRIDSLERKLARASIHPRQRGLLRLLLEAIW
jgi:hypothetical protein